MVAAGREPPPIAGRGVSRCSDETSAARPTLPRRAVAVSAAAARSTANRSSRPVSPSGVPSAVTLPTGQPASSAHASRRPIRRPWASTPDRGPARARPAASRAGPASRPRRPARPPRCRSRAGRGPQWPHPRLHRRPDPARRPAPRGRSAGSAAARALRTSTASRRAGGGRGHVDLVDDGDRGAQPVGDEHPLVAAGQDRPDRDPAPAARGAARPPRRSRGRRAPARPGRRRGPDPAARCRRPAAGAGPRCRAARRVRGPPPGGPQPPPARLRPAPPGFQPEGRADAAARAARGGDPGGQHAQPAGVRDQRPGWSAWRCSPRAAARSGPR